MRALNKLQVDVEGEGLAASWGFQLHIHVSPSELKRLYGTSRRRDLNKVVG